MGHTDAPEEFGQFLKQRLRWDGDLSYLYLRKYRDSLRPSLLGWTNFIALLWTGCSSSWRCRSWCSSYMSVVFLVYRRAFVLGMLAFVYVFYWLLTVAMYVEYLVAVVGAPAARPAFLVGDAAVPGLRVRDPRLECGVDADRDVHPPHLDSSMAPWWVLRKTKY